MTRVFVTYVFAPLGVTGCLVLVTLVRPGYHNLHDLAVFMLWSLPLCLWSGFCGASFGRRLRGLSSVLRCSCIGMLGVCLGIAWGLIVRHVFLGGQMDAFGIPTGLLWLLSTVAGMLIASMITLDHGGRGHRALWSCVFLTLACALTLQQDRVLHFLGAPSGLRIVVYATRSACEGAANHLPGDEGEALQRTLARDLHVGVAERDALARAGITDSVVLQGAHQVGSGPYKEVLLLVSALDGVETECALPDEDMCVVVQRAASLEVVGPLLGSGGRRLRTTRGDGGIRYEVSSKEVIVTGSVYFFGW